jgi:hypothetical protein
MNGGLTSFPRRLKRREAWAGEAFHGVADDRRNGGAGTGIGRRGMVGGGELHDGVPHNGICPAPLLRAGGGANDLSHLRTRVS